MILDLLIVVSALCLAEIVFGRFEIGTPVWRRALKLGIVVGVTAALLATLGSVAGLGFFFAVGLLGLGFHFWWCARQGVNPWTAEPADRYYALRGWCPPRGFAPDSQPAAPE